MPPCTCSVSSVRKLNVTSTKEIWLGVETYRRQGNERPMALITEAFDTFDGQVCKVQVNVMKGLHNSYIRSTREVLPRLPGKDLRIKSGHETGLMSGGEDPLTCQCCYCFDKLNSSCCI